MEPLCDAAVGGTSAFVASDVHAIGRTLRAIRADFDDKQPHFRAAVLLLMGPALGYNIDRVTRRSRFPRQFIAQCTRRLFDNGVWQHSGPVYTWVTPEDANFWRDVDVALGKTYRRSGPSGQVEWGCVEAWKKRYDFGTDNDHIPVTYIADSDTVARPRPVTNPEPIPAVRVKPIAPRPVLVHAGAERTIMVAADTGNAVRVVELFPDAQWL